MGRIDRLFDGSNAHLLESEQHTSDKSELIRRYAAPDWMVLEPLQSAGQIEKNDTLILNTEYGVRAAKAMKVQNAGTPDEEVVINIIKNKFFHTGMALAGTSWVKNVLILKAA